MRKLWDYMPWHCWRQGHSWLPCMLRDRRFVPPSGSSGASGASPTARTTTRPNAPDGDRQDKYPGIYGHGLGTGLPNDGDYSDVELRALPYLKHSWDEGLDSDSDSGSR